MDGVNRFENTRLPGKSLSLHPGQMAVVILVQATTSKQNVPPSRTAEFDRQDKNYWEEAQLEGLV